MLYLQVITTFLFTLLFGFMRGNYLRNKELEKQYKKTMQDVAERRSTVLSQLKNIYHVVLPSNDKYVDRNSGDIRYKKNPLIEFIIHRGQENKRALTIDDVRVWAHNNRISRKHMRQLYKLMGYSEKRYNEIDFNTLAR